MLISLALEVVLRPDPLFRFCRQPGPYAFCLEAPGVNSAWDEYGRLSCGATLIRAEIEHGGHRPVADRSFRPL